MQQHFSKLHEYLKYNRFEQFNHLVIQKISRLTVDAQFDQVNNLLSQVNTLFSDHYVLKGSPIELLKIKPKDNLTKEEIADIKLADGLAYVRCGNKLYFVDQHSDDCYLIDWSNISAEQFDRRYKPAYQSRVLSTQELVSLTNCLNHERVEYMHWYRVLFNKQYAQEILRIACHHKIEINEHVLLYVIKSFTNYFVFFNDKTMAIFELFDDMVFFIEKVNEQNSLRVQFKIDLQLSFKILFDIVSSAKNSCLFTVSNAETFYNVQISLLDILYESSLDKDFKNKIKLIKIKKTIDCSNRFEENFDIENAHAWRLKAKNLFDDFKSIDISYLYGLNSDFFKADIFFDMLLKIESKEDYDKNMHELLVVSHDNHQKIIDQCYAICLMDNNFKIIDIFSRHYLIPKFLLT